MPAPLQHGYFTFQLQSSLLSKIQKHPANMWKKPAADKN
jgi:hypothetical protein